MKKPASSYLAYMLRLWSASSEEGLQWRASLENPHTGERVAFANMKMMFAFLEQQTARCGTRQRCIEPLGGTVDDCAG